MPYSIDLFATCQGRGAREVVSLKLRLLGTKSRDCTPLLRFHLVYLRHKDLGEENPQTHSLNNC
jgi:hypothetical protein